MDIKQEPPDWFDLNKETAIYLRCECGGEGFFISKELEEDQLPIITFVRYQIGGFHRLSFFERIKMIFKILKTGKVFDDEIIINKENANKLSEFLK